MTIKSATRTTPTSRTYCRAAHLLDCPPFVTCSGAAGDCFPQAASENSDGCLLRIVSGREFLESDDPAFVDLIEKKAHASFEAHHHYGATQKVHHHQDRLPDPSIHWRFSFQPVRRICRVCCKLQALDGPCCALCGNVGNGQFAGAPHARRRPRRRASCPRHETHPAERHAGQDAPSPPPA